MGFLKTDLTYTIRHHGDVRISSHEMDRATHPGTDMGPEIRAMIIDDEPLARDLIRRHVYCRTDIHIVGESGTGTEAIRSIKRLHPDLIFLDINLPDINGFQLLEEIKSFGMPAVIFVTAYDEYALRAFEVHAVDYLLKPVGKERFFAAVDRVLHEIRTNKKMEIVDRISLAVAQYRAGSSDTTPKVVDQRIPMRDEKGATRFVDVHQIDWIEAAGDYICVHIKDANYVIRRTLNDFQSSLRRDLFVRIHRSYLVNKDRILHLEQRKDRQYIVELTNSKTLPVSRTYYKNLKTRLKKG